MAKKAAESTGSTSKTTKKSTTTTKVRNSPIPKAPAAPARPSATATATSTGTQGARRQITHEEIARKAYEIWKSGRGGTAFENWIRAERELRAQATESN